MVTWKIGEFLVKWILVSEVFVIPALAESIRLARFADFELVQLVINEHEQTELPVRTVGRPERILMSTSVCSVMT